MCGIAGFVAPGAPADEWPARLHAMAGALVHRGPDDAGVWFDEGAGVGFCHRRLSVVDLSPAGHQPMRSASGRYVVTFNGEIYNHVELRRVLASRGHAFRGRSDTEVLLAAVEAWGVRDALSQFVGMFAFALWDRDRRVLVLARDRMGEKPLYYGWQGAAFLFGSELKALRAHPSWQAGIDRETLALFFRHRYVPAPYSIYEGIRKLPPGTLLSLGTEGVRFGDLPAPEAYWSLEHAVRSGRAAPFRGSPEEAVDELEELLGRAVADQMLADVPVGAFLSGGLDSSTVVALMQARSPRPVRTFTIGFRDPAYDEAPHARAVAERLGTRHTELYVDAGEALAAVPRLPEMYDEPFADLSQIPTLLIARLARSEVTVSLTGDGGDELLGGYNRYRLARAVWRVSRRLPRKPRRLLASTLRTAPTRALNRLLRPLASSADRYGRAGPMGHKLNRLAGLLAADHEVALYQRLMNHEPASGSVVRGVSRLPATVLGDGSRWPPADDFFERMMLVDALTYLPDDILVKLDRAAMSVSLETRLPLLDHRVVEYLAWLPLDLKVRGNTSKWPIRALAGRYLPGALFERPKRGFAMPVGRWLREDLSAWADALLEPGDLDRQGLLDGPTVERLWREHRNGTRNWQNVLWSVLVFRTWHESQATAVGAGAAAASKGAPGQDGSLHPMRASVRLGH